MILLEILFVLMTIYGAFAIFASFFIPAYVKNLYGDYKPDTTGKKMNLPLGKYAFVVGLVVSTLLMMIVKIGGQEVGVIVKPTGVDQKAIHAGWHIVAPWNTVHKMDKTVWVYTCANSTKEGNKPDADAIWAPTKDGIKLGFDVSVSWRISAEDAPWIYANVTENDGGNSGRYIWLEENVIRPKLKSAMALTTSGFSPTDAYSTKRQEIQDQVFKRIKTETKTYKLIIDNVDIREVYYNPEYEKAINSKKLAEQEVLRLVEVTKQKEEQLKQASIDKDMVIQTAQGEAEALKIKGAAINSNPKIVMLEWINAWKEGGSQVPTYISGSDKGNMFLLNMKE